MQVRTYDEVDPFDVYQLTLAAFGSGLRERWVRLARRRDPRVLDEYAIYAVVRGRPVAQAIPLRMDLRLTSGIEPVGAIAGVCAHPSVWGRGYARRLMERAHEMYRERDLSIATLATSRNIRGYGLYRKLGYVDLAPFYRATRRVSRRTPRRSAVRLRKARRSDLPTVQALFDRYVRDLCGWTVRPAELLPLYVAWSADALDTFRLVLRDGVPVGYVCTAPKAQRLVEEAIVPDTGDFRAAILLLERRAPGGISTTGDLTAGRDLARFRGLGYAIAGPIPSTTMALSLEASRSTRSLPRAFGATRGRFAHYPTDDF